ncbi:hypothetical protein DL764_000714 [Monosporascus ibericus]|uniref:Uncharacterized protein n=1 Tax=Monosporascus ibericus TaxID=155417 RepID=A0A4Q4TXN1_9PEZI|nr:hypothetical protein DL764_000714 [Monosporascus ibericus]
MLSLLRPISRGLVLSLLVCRVIGGTEHFRRDGEDVIKHTETIKGSEAALARGALAISREYEAQDVGKARLETNMGNFSMASSQSTPARAASMLANVVRGSMQAMALSQGMINSQLQVVWDLNLPPPLLNGLDLGPRVAHYTATSPDFMQADFYDIQVPLQAPKIVLKVGEKPTMLYRIAVPSLHVTYTNVQSDMSNVLLNLDLGYNFDSSFFYVMEVELSQELVDPTSEEYANVVETWGIPGDWRLSTLIMDSQKKFIPRRDLSHLGNVNFHGFGASVNITDHLFQALDIWTLDNLADRPFLMHAVLAETQEGDFFHPTAQLAQTHPYLAPGSSTIHEGLTEEGDKNALVFVNMVKGRDFPSLPMPYSGNWIEPPPYDGTLAISGHIFFDEILLPVLSEVNRATFLELTEASLFPVGDDVGVEVHREQVLDRPASEYAFVWDEETECWRFTNYTDASSTFTFLRAGSEASRTIQLAADITIANTVEPIVGTNAIKITFETVLREETSGFQSGTITIERLGELTLRVKSIDGSTGKVELTFDELDELDLASAFASTVQTAGTNPQEDERVQEGILDLDFAGSAAVQDVLIDMAIAIRDRLLDMSPWVLPAGGAFLMEGAVFNENRDLLIQARYNGLSR